MTVNILSAAAAVWAPREGLLEQESRAGLWAGHSGIFLSGKLKPWLQGLGSVRSFLLKPWMEASSDDLKSNASGSSSYYESREEGSSIVKSIRAGPGIVHTLHSRGLCLPMGSFNVTRKEGVCVWTQSPKKTLSRRRSGLKCCEGLVGGLCPTSQVWTSNQLILTLTLKGPIQVHGLSGTFWFKMHKTILILFTITISSLQTKLWHIVLYTHVCMVNPYLFQMLNNHKLKISCMDDLRK